jgi:hypothetical protein
LHPSQDGAKHLHTQYGDRLICVRYRYDEQQRKRYKTVELIVEESDWEPAACSGRDDRLVQIRVALPEGAVRRQVKAAGGKWNPERQVWELRYARVVALGLTDRMVGRGGR